MLDGKYDVIVVNFGLYGNSAAKLAAEKGARTILFEEHPQIGLPEHCVGRLSETRTQFLEELVQLMDPRIVRHKVRARRNYAPSGRVAEVPLDNTGAYMIGVSREVCIIQSVEVRPMRHHILRP